MPKPKVKLKRTQIKVPGYLSKDAARAFLRRFRMKNNLPKDWQPDLQQFAKHGEKGDALQAWAIQTKAAMKKAPKTGVQRQKKYVAKKVEKTAQKETLSLKQRSSEHFHATMGAQGTEIKTRESLLNKFHKTDNPNTRKSLQKQINKLDSSIQRRGKYLVKLNKAQTDPYRKAKMVSQRKVNQAREKYILPESKGKMVVKDQKTGEKKTIKFSKKRGSTKEGGAVTSPYLSVEGEVRATTKYFKTDAHRDFVEKGNAVDALYGRHKGGSEGFYAHGSSGGGKGGPAEFHKGKKFDKNFSSASNSTRAAGSEVVKHKGKYYLKGKDGKPLLKEGVVKNVGERTVVKFKGRGRKDTQKPVGRRVKNQGPGYGEIDYAYRTKVDLGRKINVSKANPGRGMFPKRHKFDGETRYFTKEAREATFKTSKALQARIAKWQLKRDIKTRLGIKSTSDGRYYGGYYRGNKYNVSAKPPKSIYKGQTKALQEARKPLSQKTTLIKSGSKVSRLIKKEGGKGVLREAIRKNDQRVADVGQRHSNAAYNKALTKAQEKNREALSRAGGRYAKRQDIDTTKATPIAQQTRTLPGGKTVEYNVYDKDGVLYYGKKGSSKAITQYRFEKSWESMVSKSSKGAAQGAYDSVNKIALQSDKPIKTAAQIERQQLEAYRERVRNRNKTHGNRLKANRDVSSLKSDYTPNVSKPTKADYENTINELTRMNKELRKLGRDSFVQAEIRANLRLIKQLEAGI